MSYDRIVFPAIHSREVVTIVEFQLFTKNGTNIARLGTASHNRTLSHYAASISNNGSLNTNSFSHTLLDGVWTLTLDRGYTIAELDRVVLYSRPGYMHRVSGGIITMYSSNGLDPWVLGVCNTVLVQTFKINQFTLSPAVSKINVSITEIRGRNYKLTYQATGSLEENVSNDNFTDLEKSITKLSPETEYTIKLYSRINSSEYILMETMVTTTLPNLAVNHNKSDYIGSTGRFDFSTLDNDVISDIINDVFTTGDEMDVKVAGKTKTSTFVNRGGVIDVAETGAIIAPFSKDGGSGQSISMTLSDSTSVDVSYDENTEEVTIGGNVYDEGNSLILDGKKVTIVLK